MLRYDTGGYRLFLESTGEGRPTVIFEAGAGSPGSTWDPIWPSITAFARACRYDRPNLGRSDQVAHLRDLLDVVKDLHTLLTNALVPGPYVMVGHSFGGLVVRVYAHSYPEDVAGLVLIDSSHPQQYQRSLEMLPPFDPSEDEAVTACRTRYSDPETALSEGINFGRSLAQCAQTGDLGNLPVAVISRSRPNSPAALQRVRPGLPPMIAEGLEDVWQELQADLASLSRESMHLIADQCGHYVHHDNPSLVIDAIYRVVQRARGEGVAPRDQNQFQW